MFPVGPNYEMVKTKCVCIAKCVDEFIRERDAFELRMRAEKSEMGLIDRQQQTT